ncbi:M23 family metallopeptidase [Ferrimonas senticii]|uniref:M23 family metallopeptidase n=1 Tax=Ferrimonas senticii TaxID=394566 RepID=UPI0004850C5E|nr:M23 family metallopeptidase [Ferrimonas senticii]
MSVTVLLRTKHGTHRWQPGKRWFSLPVMLMLLSSGLWYWHQQQLVLAQLEQQSNQQARTEQQQRYAQLKQQTDAQLALLASKIGQLQARMNRLDAMGAAMAEQANLADQFHFDSAVGLGGPASADQQALELSELIQQLELLQQRQQRADNQLPLLESLTRNHHIDFDRYLSGRPLKSGWQSSTFGYRNDPFTGRRTMHRGTDFAGTEGGEVIATGAGVVSYSGKLYGYGNLVEIDHGNGYKTRYGHNKANLVELGQLVAKGETIAQIGSTGRSTGPHVHYEVLKNDKQVDPDRYVYRKPRSE